MSNESETIEATAREVCGQYAALVGTSHVILRQCKPGYKGKVRYNGLEPAGRGEAFKLHRHMYDNGWTGTKTRYIGADDHLTLVPITEEERETFRLFQEAAPVEVDETSETYIEAKLRQLHALPEDKLWLVGTRAYLNLSTISNLINKSQATLGKWCRLGLFRDVERTPIDYKPAYLVPFSEVERVIRENDYPRPGNPVFEGGKAYPYSLKKREKGKKKGKRKGQKVAQPTTI